MAMVVMEDKVDVAEEVTDVEVTTQVQGVQLRKVCAQPLAQVCLIMEVRDLLIK